MSLLRGGGTQGESLQLATVLISLSAPGQSLPQDAPGAEGPAGEPAGEDLHAVHSDQLEDASHGRGGRSPGQVQVTGRDHLLQVWRHGTLCKQVS